LKLHVIAVGHRPPTWVSDGFDDYARRMPRDARIVLVEIKPSPRSSAKPSAAGTARLLVAEKTRILAALPPGCVRIALDEQGKQWTTVEFARRLDGWQQEGRDVAFMIGGADGLDRYLKADADILLSLSAMTLPHALVRVMLAEQLYRALSLNRNHPYHRE
jgi:23S rRNA (pseudouridine1915-N3)-methyltransferase